MELLDSTSTRQHHFVAYFDDDTGLLEHSSLEKVSNLTLTINCAGFHS